MPSITTGSRLATLMRDHRPSGEKILAFIMMVLSLVLGDRFSASPSSLLGRHGRHRVGGRTAVLPLRAVAADPGIGPVGDLLRALRDEGAPGVGSNRTVGLPHDLELAIGLHFADEDRLLGGGGFRIERDFEARRGLERLDRK